MIDVYRFPPVAPRLWEWTLEDPVQASRSLITGADYQSGAGRRRRLAVVEIHGRRDGMGAGYMESLKELLRGGRNAVRLYSRPINWHLDATRAQDGRQSQRIDWTDGAAGLDWTAGAADLHWFAGALLAATSGTAGSWPAVTVSGLPPDTLVARPSEFLTVFSDAADRVGTTVRILSAARSNGDGVAVIRLHEAVPSSSGVRVNIGTSDTGVFRPVQIPRAPQPASGDWAYRWNFREVFAAEVGGFTELNPWS